MELICIKRKGFIQKLSQCTMFWSNHRFGWGSTMTLWLICASICMSCIYVYIYIYWYLFVLISYILGGDFTHFGWNFLLGRGDPLPLPPHIATGPQIPCHATTWMAEPVVWIGSTHAKVLQAMGPRLVWVLGGSRSTKNVIQIPICVYVLSLPLSYMNHIFIPRSSKWC